MNSEDFESLKRSLIEVGEIMRGEKPPAREFVYEVDRSQIKPPFKTRAICMDLDNDWLIPGKLYEVEMTNNAVWVRDEDDELTVCPPESFVAVELPAEVIEKMTQLSKAA
jgi:hypothetical protein